LLIRFGDASKFFNDSCAGFSVELPEIILVILKWKNVEKLNWGTLTLRLHGKRTLKPPILTDSN
jgi:hypothetical protein